MNLPGTMDGPRRLLSAHVDTVGVHRGAEPVIRGDRIVSSVPGVGVATDNRAGVAIVLYAALRVWREKLPHPPLTLLFTVQHENGGQGARFADVEHFGRPAMGFTWDGGQVNNIRVGGLRKSHTEIEIRGRGGHAGGGGTGSALLIFARAVTKLDADGWLGRVEKDGARGSSNLIPRSTTQEQGT